ncbi:PAS domain-containing protein, partial [Adonisia turfae]|uniref:PAS domain-containing protein n=1 Tax=Adonisia turfae TaxID=2950184 RepID=UPI002029B314
MVSSEHHQAKPPLFGQNLELFFAITPSLLCITDFDGYFKHVNPQFSKVLGYSSLASITQPLIEFVHPDDREATQHALDALVHNHQAITFDHRYRCANGGYRYLVWNAIAQGNLIYAAANDITEQKQTEQTLFQERDFSKSILATINSINEHPRSRITQHYSQQTLENIFDLAGEAIICVDQRQTIRLFNQAAERIFGYMAAEAINQPLDLLLPAAFKVIHRQHIDKFGKSSVPSLRMGERRGNVSGRRKNGEIFPAEASISKSRTKDGLVWYTVMLQDITERLQAEAAIRRSEEQLRK